MTPFTARPELVGTFGAVASTHWIASAVGMRMLEAGGNAFDAAVAAGFTLQVVEPHLNGPGGDAPILAARHGDAEPTVICGQGGAPAAATIEAFEALGLDLIPATGLLVACVPGAFGAWATLLRDWGSLSLREVLEPAIDYARGGQPILEGTVAIIGSVEPLFREEWTTSAEVFLPGGELPRAGELFRRPALADLFERLLAAAESAGADRRVQIEAALAYWYEGPVAEAIDHFFRNTEAVDSSGRRHRGFLTANDMAGWRPPIERPLSVDFGDYAVFKCGPWSQGPSLLQALRLLEGCDLEALDPAGPEFVHLVVETLKLVMADRDAWYGDDPAVPIGALLSRTYASERRKLIGRRASLDLNPGAPGDTAPRMPRTPVRSRSLAALGGSGEPTMAQGLASSDPTPAKAHAGDTCHVDVVDRWGNMVSATPSGGWLQSSPVVPQLGFPLGSRMQMFFLDRGHPNALKPYKRPRTTLTPSMAFKRGRPYLAFGTPGGDQQEQWSLLLFLLHAQYGVPLQRAIETPAFHTDHLVASFWPRDIAAGAVTIEGRFDPSVAAALTARGHRLTIGPDWSEGRLSACAYDVSGDAPLIRAGANPRGMQGYAIAR